MAIVSPLGGYHMLSPQTVYAGTSDTVMNTWFWANTTTASTTTQYTITYTPATTIT